MMVQPSPTLDLNNLAVPGSPTARALAYLRAQAGPIYLVGGSVRDMLLKRASNDLDLAVPGGGLVLARQVADRLGGAFFPLDEERDTGRAILSDDGGSTVYVDCAALRGTTLATDLQLRDFTINALAVDLTRPELTIVDEVGGLQDLAQGLIRMASARALSDDPLRGLRAVRLAAELRAWGLRLEDNTLAQLGNHAASLARVSAERIRDELVRILDSRDPAIWLGLMADLNQLAVVLPEVDALRNVAQSRPHQWDVFQHTLRVVHHVAWLQEWLNGQVEPRGWIEESLTNALAPWVPALKVHLAQGESAVRSRASTMRWAALAHDWGKPATRSEEPADQGPPRTRFLGHDRVGAELAAQALRRLRFNDAEVQRVSGIVAHHMRPALLASSGMAPSRRAVFRFVRDTGDAGVDIALISLADHRATFGADREQAGWSGLLAVATRLLAAYCDPEHKIVMPAPLVNGTQLIRALKLSPGPQVGQLLREIVEAQAAGELTEPTEALAFAGRLVDRSRAASQDG